MNIVPNIRPKKITHCKSMSYILLCGATRNTLNITSEDNTDIRILNVSGSVVLKEHLNKGINTIDVSKLVDGLYFMYCNKGTVKRFIIKDN